MQYIRAIIWIKFIGANCYTLSRQNILLMIDVYIYRQSTFSIDKLLEFLVNDRCMYPFLVNFSYKQVVKVPYRWWMYIFIVGQLFL